MWCTRPVDGGVLAQPPLLRRSLRGLICNASATAIGPCHVAAISAMRIIVVAAACFRG